MSVGDVPASLAAMQLQSRVDQTLYAFRLRGHLLAQIDPLGRPRPQMNHVADLAWRATRRFTAEELEQVVDSSDVFADRKRGPAARSARAPPPHLLRAHRRGVHAPVRLGRAAAG